MKNKQAVFTLVLGLGLLLTLSILLAATALATPTAPLACVAGPHSGTISANETWCAADNPHLLTSDVTVASGVTLTVEPGVIVQGNAYARLQVYGHLDALGTVTQPITFTSSSGASGGWEGLYFYGGGTNQGSGHLRHATVQYGGGSSTYANIYADYVQGGNQVLIESSRVVSASYSTLTDYGLRARTSNVVVSDTLFSDNGNATGDYALYATNGSAITVTGSTFQNNAGYAARVEPDGPFTMSGNTFSGNGYDRVLLKSSIFAGDNSLPAQTGLEGYELENDVTVPASTTLTVDAGAAVLGRDYARLQVYGHLDALGTASQPITFTSSSGASSGWEGLYFYGGGTNQGSGHLRHATVQYGGGYSTYANIYAQNVQDGYQVLIESSRVLSASHSSTDYGLRARTSNVVVSDTLFSDNGNATGDYALYATSGSAITVTGSTFQNNAGYGLYVNGSQANLTCSTVANNGNDGIYLTGSSSFWTLSSGIYGNAGLGLNNTTGSSVDATYNWWGDPSGPTHASNPGGSGEEVSDNVLYDHWLPRQECACDLSVAKSDTPDPVIASAALTYTLVVTNAGPGEATAVVVTDTLPPSMTFASAAVSQGTSCSESGGVVTCTLGTLAVGNDATITLTVDVDPAARGMYTNTAAVAASQTDHVPASNTTTETTTATGEADLSVAKTNTPDPAIAGDTLTYTLTITNSGPSQAIGVTLTDTLPAEVTFGSATPGQGTGCSEAGGVVTCHLGDLAPGAVATATIVSNVDPAARGTITNTANVAGTDPDPDLANNTATKDATVNAQADLSVAKTNTPDPGVSGDTLTYTLTITNGGPSQATGVTLTDTLPTEVTFGSVTASQGACNEAGGVVTCDLGDLAPGAVATATIVSDVDPAVQGTITNTANVAGSEPDPDLANNTATKVTTVSVQANLSVAKTNTPDPAIAGATLTYALTVTNSGPSQATWVTLTDTLPAEVTFGSATLGQGKGCNEAGGVVTCDLGDLASGAVATATIVSDVDPAARGTITNIANVAGTEIDPDPANNTATKDATVNAQADLSVAKSDAPDPVLAGDTLTYTLTVTNNGPSQATGVTLTDTLPAEVTFGSATPGQGTGCSEAGGIVTCHLGDLAPGAVATATIVSDVDPAARGTITNTANVAGSEPDPDPANNTATKDATVNAQADLSVAKSDAPDPVKIETEDTLTYTLTTTNGGPSKATGIVLTDSLPAVVTFGSATASQGACNEAGGVVTCDLGGLLPETAATVAITVTVAPTTTGTFSNTVTVSGAERDDELGNNTAVAPTTIRLYIYLPLLLRNVAP
jgi:uncharacterized repeat protein (TIGR01451 family)